MSSVRSSLIRLTSLFALGGFTVGGIGAIRALSAQRHVREFQAGSASPLSERITAIAERAAVDGLGFGFLGLLLCVPIFLLAACGKRGSFGERVSAALVLVLTVLALWMRFGANLMNEAVAFLPPAKLLALNAACMAVVLGGLFLVQVLVSRLPGAKRDEPVATALGTALAFGCALQLGLDYLRASARDTPSFVLTGGILLLALPAALLFARLLQPVVAFAAGRLERSRHWPRRIGASLGLALVFCSLVGRPFVDTSPLPSETRFPEQRSKAEDGPNVVLVTIDTLRADHLGCYGYERPTSPFIDSLAEGGTRFADPISAAAWTKPATGTILTGLYPSRHGALYHGSRLEVPEGERTLAEAFRQAGYATAGFVSNPNVKKVFDFDRGFDQYFDSPVEDTVGQAAIRDSLFGRLVKKLTNFQFNWKYENDIRQMNRQVFKWLEENHDQRFFLYVHYIDPHEPYAPPAEYERDFQRDHGLPLFNERKAKVGVDLYDAEIRYTDDGIRELVESLEGYGVWEDTLFVITSDHGEEFFEHEVLGHGFSLYQEVVQVPLIAHGPGVAEGRVVEDPVQIVDLAATLCDLAGVGTSELGDGRSFAASMRGLSWESEGYHFVENEFGEDEHDRRSFVLNSVRRGPWKLVLTEKNRYRPPHHPRYGPVELYDLDADPEEQNNLAESPEHQEIARDLTQRLRAHMQELVENGNRDAEAVPLSPALEAELRALGYL